MPLLFLRSLLSVLYAIHSIHLQVYGHNTICHECLVTEMYLFL
ncbi:hypothetical protein [Bacillus phage vB_BceS-M2]